MEPLHTCLCMTRHLKLSQECGVEASLVRVWIGLDPKEHLLQVFGEALDVAADAVYNGR